MNIKFVKATLEDAPILAKLKINIWQNVYKEILPDAYLNTLTIENKIKKYEEELQNNSCKEIYLLEADNTIIGTLRIKYCQGLSNLKCICIEDLYLIPQYHNKGYGGLAINFVYKKAIEKDCDAITAWIIETNTVVRKMAGKFGFIETTNIQVHVSTGVKLIQYYFTLKR